MDNAAHDYLHARAQKIISQKLLELFAKEGYKEIAVPMVDKYNHYRELLQARQAERNNRIQGGGDEPLLMRPDVTLFLTRSIANSLRAIGAIGKKARLCYAENVVRDLLNTDGVGREQFHTGVELFGNGNNDKEQEDEIEEIIFLAIHALETLGLKDCRIHIGTRSLFNDLIGSYHDPAGFGTRLMTKYAQKIYGSLSSIIIANNHIQLWKSLRHFMGFTVEKCDALLALFSYRSSSESDTHELIKMFNYDLNEKNIVVEQLGRLHSLCDKLNDRITEGKHQPKVVVDPSEVGQHDYYTDIAFSTYSPVASSRITGGGRYDRLADNFTELFMTPGCGFSFFQERFVDYFIPDAEAELSEKNEPVKPSQTSGKPLTSAADLITIAIPKGRIFEKIKGVLKDNGVVLDFAGRSLISEDKELGVRWQLVKNVDVPAYVNNGTAHLGIVGSDILDEYPDFIATLHAFEFGSARMALITTQKNQENQDAELYNGVTIATKYPVATQEYLDFKGIDGRIIKLNGSLELAPLLKLAPFIVDIVETGTTMKNHNLVEVDDLDTTKVLLAANPAYYKLHAQRIKDKILPILAEN